MSAISVILLATAGTAVGLGTAALHTARCLRGDLAALRAELAGSTTVPGARTAPAAEEIRAAVARALAEERERELAEARAYWAEHDARGAEGTALLNRRGLDYDVAEEADEELLDAMLERYLLSDSAPQAAVGREGTAFLPRQQEAADTADDGPQAPGAPEAPEAPDARQTADRAGAEHPGEPDADLGDPDALDEEDAEEDPDEDAAQATAEAEAAELAAARRRHPSHPGYTLTGEPVGEQQRTATRLAQLAEARTPLADVRPGPPGALDVFLFADGTSLCLTPSHDEPVERLVTAIRAGRPPVLMGGSGISGAYALTFSCGAESVYLLADRVVATSARS